MLFVAIGVVLLLLKLAALGPFGEWSWFLVLSPFGLAVLWWWYADKSGFTQRKAMQRMDERKAARRERALDGLGQGDPNKRRKR